MRSRGIGRRRRMIGAGIVGGGATPTPTLPSLPDPIGVWIAHENYAANLFQEDTKSTLADQNGDVIGAVVPLEGATDASQSSLGPKPLLRTNGINGHWAMEFDGLDDNLLATGLNALSGSKTAYFLYDPDGATGTAQHLMDIQSGRLIFSHLGTTPDTSAWGDGIGFRVEAAASANAQILSFVLNSGSGTGEMFRNGVSLGTDTYLNRAVNGGIAIGSNYVGSGAFLAGKIGAIGVYNTAHTPSEQAEMYDFLNQLYEVY